MRICESVFEISKEFLKKDSIVFINEKGIEDTSILMINKGVKKFPIKEITKDHIYQAVVQEFVGCAINYCYWYGISDVRPNQASSGKMYSLVGDAFCDYQQGSALKYGNGAAFIVLDLTSLFDARNFFEQFFVYA